MSLRITVDIFSGRPNPAVELTGALEKEARERLKPERKLSKSDLGLPPGPTLGYRGLIIEQAGKKTRNMPRIFRYAHGDLFAPKFAFKAADKSFEDFVCGTGGPLVGKFRLGKEFPLMFERENIKFLKVRTLWPWEGKIIWPPLIRCRCAPLYEPDWWNDGGTIQHGNNCYNYGCNYRTDTFAQPGKASGAMYTSLAGCSVPAPGRSARDGAISDGLIDSPLANNKCPAEGHLVALVIWPGVDFHWYRKGRNGYWSHKPGGTQVTNLDNSGKTIPDPRTADRGGYTQFCTFMTVMHGHIKIK